MHATPRSCGRAGSTPTREDVVKGLQKPKKPGMKPAQKTLKERRVEKRAAAKQTRSLDA